MAFQNEVWTPMEVIHKSLNLSNACCKGREVSAPLHSGEQKIASKGSISRSFLNKVKLCSIVTEP